MQTLTDALARQAGRLTLGARAVAVERLPDGTLAVAIEQGDMRATRHARAVVIATPAHAAAKLVEPIAPEAARALAQIEYPPVTVVASAYRREDVAHSLGGFGMLAPKKENRALLGTLFSSSMFEGRADAGHVMLTTFVGGRRNPGLATDTDERIVGEVAREHRELLGTRAAPLWNALTRWPQAIPQYELGHLARVAKLAEAEAQVPGLRFCANYRGGVSVGDCIANAAATAESLEPWLRARTLSR